MYEWVMLGETTILVAMTAVLVWQGHRRPPSNGGVEG
jgi:hypothetical protein